jgi:hypothetical protein
MSQDLEVPQPPKEANRWRTNVSSHLCIATRVWGLGGLIACGGLSQDFDPGGPRPALGVAWPRASIHHQHFWAHCLSKHIARR